ncbi:MAG: hypothetical protein IOD15_15030 [Phycisphaerales bacterium]|nr:hypothetical protein [Phycisphaerales bacterium]
MDWVPESWPPAIERINAAIRQLIAVDGIANPEAQRIKHAEATNRLSAAVSQFPIAESADLFVPLVVRGFVAANAKNQDLRAWNGLVDFLGSGGQNTQVFVDLALQDIADRYGTFAICEIRYSPSKPTSSQRLLGGSPRSIETIVVAGDGTDRELGERSLYIAEKLWMTQPLCAAFVFVDSVDDGEFAKLDNRQELWLRTAFTTPGILDRRKILHPSALVIGIAPRSMNSNTQRAHRGLETTAQAVQRLRLAEEARKAEVAADRKMREEAKNREKLAAQELADARAAYWKSVSALQQTLIDEIVRLVETPGDNALAARVFTSTSDSLVLQIKDAFVTNRSPDVVMTTPDEVDLRTVLRFCLLNRLRAVQGDHPSLKDFGVQKAYFKRLEELRLQEAAVVMKASVKGHDNRKIGSNQTSSAPLTIPVSVDVNGARSGHLTYARSGQSRIAEVSWSSLPADLVRAIDSKIEAVVRSHDWVSKRDAKLAAFKNRFGVDP